MTKQGNPWCRSRWLAGVLAAAPACFNPPSDVGLDTGPDTVAPTTSATTEPMGTTSPGESTAGPVGTSSDTAAVVDSASESASTTESSAECGDGMVGGDETCDDAGESARCDADCTPVECGDGTANAAASEGCDEAGETASCDADCTVVECGDETTNATAGEQCDDGNGIPGDGCNACQLVVACSGGAVMLAESPGGTMVVCDDPTNTVCEQEAETLCPVGWGLCTREQHVNRNTGLDFVADGIVAVVGEIHCRTGGGAGHFTIAGYDGVTNLDQDPPMNCHYGSSRESCESGFGCNEQSVHALCCAPTPSCGNGIVDAPEELCDDGNASEVDECLSSCSWRLPGNHGQPNCS